MQNHLDLPESVIDQFKAPPSFFTDLDLVNRQQRDQFEYTLCAICGLDITDPGTTWRPHAPGTAWRSDAVVIGDPAREYEYVQTNRSYLSVNQEPRVYSAKRDTEEYSLSKGCYFRLQDTVKASVYAADSDRENGGPEGENTVYFPLHRACFQIALKLPLWEQPTASPLRGLFRVLRHRYQVVWEQYIIDNPREAGITRQDVGWHNAPYDNPIPFSGFQNTDGIERGYCTSERPEYLDPPYMYRDRRFKPKGLYFMQDPLEIPDLTKTLLTNLEPRTHSKRTKAVSRFREHIAGLPNELQLLIFRHVTEAQDWPLECTRLLGSRFWKSMFNKNHPCMSWLFDLDHRLIHRADRNLASDWELLFRKLQQGPRLANCFGGNPDTDLESYRGVLSNVPPGLESRRRLWKLLEEMYVGDKSTRWTCDYLLCRVSPMTNKIISKVPVYWGRYGEALDGETLRAL